MIDLLLTNSKKLFKDVKAIPPENVLCESQHGFRPERSTNDLIFTNKMMLEKSWKWEINKMALFIDMEKAFDQVKRVGLRNIMMDE